MTNNGGPKILTCGLPDFTDKESDEQLLIDTNWQRLDKYDSNQDNNLSVIPTDHNFIRETMSKAWENPNK